MNPAVAMETLDEFDKLRMLGESPWRHVGWPSRVWNSHVVCPAVSRCLAHPMQGRSPWRWRDRERSGFAFSVCPVIGAVGSWPPRTGPV